jgi:FMN-dependent NADH-azoreductase
MQVLVIQSSLRTAGSATRRMTDAFLDELRSEDADVSVTIRDLAVSPVPHLPDELVPLQLGVAEVDSPAARLSDELIEELEAADLIVFGLPMYNFTVPSTVKAWFDHVVRARRTFTYDQNGPVGLLPPGKRAVALIASGGAYGDASPVDFLAPYLRWMLSFIGINDLSVIRAEQQANPEQGALQTAQAEDQARERAAAAVKGSDDIGGTAG